MTGATVKNEIVPYFWYSSCVPHLQMVVRDLMITFLILFPLDRWQFFSVNVDLELKVI